MLECSPERDVAIVAMLPHVPEHGWSVAALRGGLRESLPGSETLFQGSTDMVEAYIDWADRRMTATAGEWPASLSGRVRALITRRLEQAEPERAAVRRAAAVLCLPTSAGAAARSLARTVDAIWHAAGDPATDWNWYTKRATLAAVYGATLLRWLGDTSGGADSLAFLDRRLADLGRIARVRTRLANSLGAGRMRADTAVQPPAA